MNEFKGMKGALDEAECCDHIPLPMPYVEKWRIMLWTEAFQLLFRGPHGFIKFTTVLHYTEGKSVIKCVVYVIFPRNFLYYVGMVYIFFEFIGFY